MASMRSSRKILATLLLVCGHLSFASSAWGDNLKDAEKLYAAAVKEMAAGKYAKACPLFEEAKEKAPDHVRTGMTLGQCYAEWGKSGSAFEELQRVRAVAARLNKADKVTAIDEQLADLKKNGTLLTIKVSAEIKDLAGLSILSNGKDVPMSQWDTAVPVNPGTYKIEATASGKDHWETSVQVETPKKTVTVLVSPSSWTLTTPSNGSAPTDESPQTAKPPSSKTRTFGFVGLGLGGAALVAGSIFGGLAISKQKDGASYCNAQNACTQAGYDLRSDAYGFGNVSTALVAVGGALAVTGIVLIVVGGKNKENADKTETSLLLGPTGIGMSGRW